MPATVFFLQSFSFSVVTTIFFYTKIINQSFFYQVYSFLKVINLRQMTYIMQMFLKINKKSVLNFLFQCPLQLKYFFCTLYKEYNV